MAYSIVAEVHSTKFVGAIMMLFIVGLEVEPIEFILTITAQIEKKDGIVKKLKHLVHQKSCSFSTQNSLSPFTGLIMPHLKQRFTSSILLACFRFLGLALFC